MQLEHATVMHLFLIPLCVVIASRLAPTNSFSDLVQIGLDVCQVDQLCNGNISVTSGSTGCCSPCSCDRSCVMSRNCCPDANFDITSLPVNPYLQFLTCESNNVSSPQGVILDHLILHFTMVSKCPNGSSCKQIGHGEHMTSGLWSAVAVSERTHGTIFINRQCALCHGITDVEEWTLESQYCLRPLEGILQSLETRAKSIQSIAKECVVTMIPSVPFQSISERFICKSVFYTKCNETKHWDGVSSDAVNNACESGTFEIFSTASQTQMRNPFCLYCNIAQAKRRIYIDFLCRVSDQDKTFFSKYSNLFQIIAPGNDVSIDMKCGVSEVFDEFQAECRTLHCPLFSRPKYGICEKLPIEVHHYRYTVVLCFTSSSAESIFKMAQLYVSPYPNYFINHALHLLRIRRECINHAHELIYHGVNSTGSGMYVIVELVTVFPECYLSEVTQYLEAISENRMHVNLANNNFRVDLVEYPTFLNDTLDFLFQGVYSSHKARLEKLNPIYIDTIHSSIERNYPIMFTDIPMLSANSPYACPYISLNESQICDQLLVRDCNPLPLKYYFHRVPTLLKVDVIQFQYRICIDMYNELSLRNKPKQATIEGWVSLILSSVSLVCIVFTIGSKLKEGNMDSTSKGLFVASVCNLFVAQANFQFGSGWTSHAWLCRMSGILLHYSWLATVFAFNAYSILIDHMLRSFVNASPTVSLVKYLFVYTYMTPAVFVAVNIVLSYEGYDHNIGYGDSYENCNINTSLMRGLLLALPIFLCVTVNLLVFLRISLTIKSVAAKTKSMTFSRYQYAATIFRLLMFTGITWFLGFLNEVVHSDTLGFIFTVTQAGQGVAFCLAFVCDVCKPTRTQRKGIKVKTIKLDSETK